MALSSVRVSVLETGKRPWLGVKAGDPLQSGPLNSLNVSGFNLINLRFEFSDVLRDPDGVTRHGVMRFRAIILGS